MLKANGYRETDNGFELTYEWDDMTDLPHAETREFESKEKALRFYASTCHYYIICGMQKIKDTAEKTAISLPPWTNDLLQMNWAELAVKVSEYVRVIDFRKVNYSKINDDTLHVDETIKRYLKSTVKNIYSAAEDLRKITEKYKDLK